MLRMVALMLSVQRAYDYQKKKEDAWDMTFRRVMRVSSAAWYVPGALTLGSSFDMYFVMKLFSMPWHLIQHDQECICP